MATLIGDVSVSLSHRLNDKVTNAGDNGKTFSSVIRRQYIHDGQKTLFTFIYERYLKQLIISAYDRSMDISQIAMLKRLKAWYPTVSVAANSSAVIDLSVSPTFDQLTDIVSVFNSDMARPVTLVPYNEIDKVTDFTSRFYPSTLRCVGYVSGTSLYIKPADADTKLKNFSVTFVKSPKYSATESDYFTWDDTFVPDLISMAEAQAFRDNGEPEKAMAIENRVLAMYGPIQEAQQ